MLVRINANKLISELKNCNWPNPSAEYLKFFSLLYDEKAIRSGIIEKEMALPMTFVATLIYRDLDLYEWMELRYHFNHERMLYIIGSFFQQGCFAKDVDIKQLAKYLLSRWKFRWGSNADYVMDCLSLYSLYPAVDDHLAYYWKVACMTNKYNPNPKKK